MPIITLTSDYGLQDPYLATVKGALYTMLPEATLCDISHQIEPGNMVQAFFIFNTSYRFFPKNSIHLFLVNEVTRQKRWLAARLKGQYVLCSDSGFLALLTAETKPEEVYEITIGNNQSLFPGKEFLAEAACHLARGGALSVIGRKTEKWLKGIRLNQVFKEESQRIVGNIMYIDNFGNLITNVTKAFFEEHRNNRKFEINLPKQQTISKMVQFYSDAKAGDIVLLFNAHGFLEIALIDPRGKEYNGANSMLGLEEQNEFFINFL
jgi:S-adenosylmethionine hydrolase